MNRKRAVTCVLLNLTASPGLGSLLARRWIEGTGQLLLSLAGFAMIMVWFVKLMIEYYGQISGGVTVKPMGWIGLTGAVLFALAWGWSLVTSFSLLREPSHVSLKSLEHFAADQIKMDEAKIILSLSSLRDWKREDQVISHTFEFADFVGAMKFVNAVATLAEEAQHHPDIDVRWNRVTLALSTHDAGGLTEKDFTLARQCDALARR
jgi:4a-hydroxytetrahydrobiopterin dehydratase